MSTYCLEQKLRCLKASIPDGTTVIFITTLFLIH